MSDLAPPIRMLHISDAQRRHAALAVAEYCEYDRDGTRDVLVALGLAVPVADASGVRLRSIRDEDGQHWWAGAARAGRKSNDARAKGGGRRS